MLWPNGTTARPRVSSAFGPRPNVGAFSFHYGTDLTGYSTVCAAGAGKVAFAGWMNDAAGNTVVIDHGGGVTELHMHLASFAVKRGDGVSPGDALGRMGKSGNASGNCDHFEIRVNGKSVDPIAYTAARLPSAPAGGGNKIPSPEEDDMFTDQDRQRLDAAYAALFGPENLKLRKMNWATPDGNKEAFYGVLDITIYTQQLVMAQTGQLAALAAAVAQLKGGGTIDMKALADAAERGAKDALSGLVLTADVKG